MVKDAVVPYAATKDRRDYILDKMLEYKKITQEQHDAAIAAPIAPAIKQPSTGCATAGGVRLLLRLRLLDHRERPRLR